MDAIGMLLCACCPIAIETNYINMLAISPIYMYDTYMGTKGQMLHDLTDSELFALMATIEDTNIFSLLCEEALRRGLVQMP